MSILDEVREAAADRDANILGSICWWTLSDGEVDRSLLLSLWAREGLDPKLLPEEVGPEKAFGIATREAQVGQKDRILRLGRRDESAISVAILREWKTSAGDVSTSQECKVTLDRRARAVDSDYPAHDLAQVIMARYQALLSRHTDDDVRQSIVKAMRAFAAVPLRPTGGVWFIPAPSMDEANRLASAVSGIGRSALFLVPVGRSPQAESAIGVAAAGSIESELASLQQEIDRFLVEPPSRESTLARRLGTYDEVRRRAELYRAILGCTVETLDERLDAMASAIHGILDGTPAVPVGNAAPVASPPPSDGGFDLASIL